MASSSADERRSEPASEGSGASSDGGGDAVLVDALPLRKKRRSTFQIRKEQKETLHAQITRLQEELDALDGSQGGVSRELRHATAVNRQLTSSIERNHMAMAGAQAMISSYVNSAWQPALSTYIHLPVDPGQRAQYIESMSDSKIQFGTQFMLERTRFLDLRREQCHTDSCELDNGDLVFTRFDVTPFGRAFSVQHILDEVRNFITFAEISISEALGIISVLEGEEVTTSMARQHRLLSTFHDGLQVESNTVAWIKFLDSETQPIGLGVVDFVDYDAAYPYDPETRLQRDLVAGLLVAECPPDVEGEPPIVSVSRWISVRLHKASFPLSKSREIQARESLRMWSNVMIKAVQERLGLR